MKKQQEQEVYVCSDPHINHQNLVRGSSNWKDKTGCRNFNSLGEHNQVIIEGINNTVKEDDILYCLGDWSFGGIGSIWWFRKQIKCKDIRFIYGNHDHHIEDNKDLRIKSTGWEDLSNIPKEQRPENYNEWSYRYNRVDYIGKGDVKNNKFYIPAQNLFTWCKYYAEVKHFGHTYVLSHYAFDVWNKRHHGRMHLFGHSHGTLGDRGDRRMDVGFEEAYRILGEWRPFNIKECQSRLQSRTNKPLDHHNENTN